MDVINNCVCTVSKGNIHIQDSYKVETKKEMRAILEELYRKYPLIYPFKRSFRSLISEWRTHNRLYKWGYKRERTADVDLNYPQKWYVKIAYAILGI